MVVRVHTRDFFRIGHLPTLIASFLYFDISFMIWVLLGALGPLISAEFGLTGTQKGLMIALPLLGGSIFRLILGPMTDHYGPRRVGIAGMLLTLIPLVWGWLGATGYGEILVIGLLLGIAGASFAVALPMASHWYPREYQGLALGIAGAGNSGTVLATLFAPRLAKLLGWHSVLGLAAVPLLVAFAVFVAVARDGPDRPKALGLASYRRVLRQGDTAWLSLFYSVTFGGFVGLVSFLTTYFVDQYRLDPVTAGLFTSLCVISASFLRPVGGFLADRFGGTRLLTVLFGVIAVSMAGVAQAPPLMVVFWILLTGLTAMGLGNGAVFQLVAWRFPREMGTLTGIVGAVGGLGGYFLPFGLGALQDLTGSYSIGFYSFGLIAGSLVLLVVALENRWRSSPASEPTL